MSKRLSNLAKLFLLAAIFWPLSLFGAAAPYKVVYTFGGLNERSGILWVARDAGIFHKYGIDPTIVNVRNAQVGMSALAAGETIRIVSDRIGSPTYLKDLARAIVALIRAPFTGVMHFGSAGEPTSRYHVVRELALRLGMDTQRLVAIPSSDWSGDRATRPLYSALDCGLYARVTGRSPRTWLACLDEYIAERNG